MVMSLDATQLYALLPAIYRTRDVENGNPLQALLAVMASQSAVVEENIQQLYDDQFIETCAPSAGAKARCWRSSRWRLTFPAGTRRRWSFSSG
jgi:hypothetical protein